MPGLPPAAPAHQEHQRSPGAQQVKTCQDLTPQSVRVENSPVELKAWLLQYWSYFSASGLERLTKVQPQVCLLTNIDVDLGTRITAKLVESDDLDQALKKLNDLFMEKYPLFQRRLKFWMHQQQQNQKFSDWAGYIECFCLDKDRQFIFNV